VNWIHSFIQPNGLDPLRDEGIQYALRLMAADVPVELYCAPTSTRSCG
jgi:acetyl esterase/lipase